MRFVVDTSAWTRRDQDGVREKLMGLYEAGELCFAGPQALEIAHATRNPKEHRKFMNVVRQHTLLPVDDHAVALAFDIQRSLWEKGLVRAAGAMDVLLAAICVCHDATMVHFDRDYDHINTVLPDFRCSWVASPASS